MYDITDQHPDDDAAIERLLDVAFGPERHAKTSYRYRRGVAPVDGLSLVARDRSAIVGTIAYWPVTIGAARTPGLLLGPLAVAPERHGRGIGAGLIRRSLEGARKAGHRRVLLVGDGRYYRPFGFRPAEGLGIAMPGEPPGRLQGLGLAGNAFAGVCGPVMPWRCPRPGLMAA